MFRPNANHKRNRPWQGGRGPGNLGAFDGVRLPPAYALTGAYGRPSWPCAALPVQQQAIPKAALRRQIEADYRLIGKGGSVYLKAWGSRPAGKRRAARMSA
jgi:hypothetical protein